MKTLRILGTLAVQEGADDPTPVRLERIPRLILAMLICEGPGPIERSTLIEHIWGEPDWTKEREARALERRLTVHASKVRTKLGVGAQLASDYGTSLELKRGPSGFVTDWDLLARAGSARERRTIVESLKLVRGPVMAGLDAPILDAYRDQQLEMVGTALRKLGDFDESEISRMATALCLGGEAILEEIEQAGRRRPRSKPSPEAAVEALRQHRSRSLDSYLHRSTRLRLRHLWEVDGLMVHVPWRPYGARDRTLDEVAVDHVARRLSEMSSSEHARPILVLAPSGTGKSTLAHAVVRRLEVAGTEAVYVDLGRLRLVSTPDTATILDDSSLWTSTPRRLAILDGVDEYLAGKSGGEIAQELARPLFGQAAMLACRTQYFERYWAHTDVAAQLEKIELLPWDYGEQERYVLAYFQHFFPHHADRLARTVLARLRASSEVRDLLAIPLRLAMAVELVSPEGKARFAGISDLLGLYEHYTDELVAREVERGVTVLEVDEFHDCLQDLAWMFYDEGASTRGGTRGFTYRALREFAQAYAEGPDVRKPVAHVIADLEQRSLLAKDSGSPRVSPATAAMTFGHKSFQEFYVASYLHSAWQTGPTEAGAAFQRFVSPEVSEFLKEYIARINRRYNDLEAVANNIVDALTLLEGLKDSVHGLRAARQRIARQQLGYYLGVMHSLEGHDYLRTVLAREDDAWIRRGIVIGFAFHGDTTYLDEYITTLQRERTSGGATPESDVNVGFHLSFFGDQPFDPYAPDVDQDLPEVAGCVEHLVYQLGTETDRGSWRLNLYTLCDLWDYRPGSNASFGAALRERAESVWRVIESLEADPAAQDWPELARFRALATAILQSRTEVSQ